MADLDALRARVEMYFKGTVFQLKLLHLQLNLLLWHKNLEFKAFFSQTPALCSAFERECCIWCK